MSEELKPCPFCGEKPELIYLEKYGYCYCCGDTHVGTHYCESGSKKTEAEAREAWNARTEGDEPETGIMLERQAKRIMLLEAERDEAISRIKAHCKDCWAFRGKDPAQCRTCALHPYKEPERWKTVLAGNWDEVPGDE